MWCNLISFYTEITCTVVLVLFCHTSLFLLLYFSVFWTSLFQPWLWENTFRTVHIFCNSSYSKILPMASFRWWRNHWWSYRRESKKKLSSWVTIYISHDLTWCCSLPRSMFMSFVISRVVCGLRRFVWLWLRGSFLEFVIHSEFVVIYLYMTWNLSDIKWHIFNVRTYFAGLDLLP